MCLSISSNEHPNPYLKLYFFFSILEHTEYVKIIFFNNYFSSKSSKNQKSNTKKTNAGPEKIKTECYHCHKITVTKDSNGLCDKCDKILSPTLILTRIKENSIKPLLETSTVSKNLKKILHFHEFFLNYLFLYITFSEKIFS